MGIKEKQNLQNLLTKPKHTLGLSTGNLNTFLWDGKSTYSLAAVMWQSGKFGN